LYFIVCRPSEAVVPVTLRVTFVLRSVPLPSCFSDRPANLLTLNFRLMNFVIFWLFMVITRSSKLLFLLKKIIKNYDYFLDTIIFWP